MEARRTLAHTQETDMMPSVDDTIAFIRRAHAGQVDKDGTEY